MPASAVPLSPAEFMARIAEASADAQVRAIALAIASYANVLAAVIETAGGMPAAVCIPRPATSAEATALDVFAADLAPTSIRVLSAGADQ